MHMYIDRSTDEEYKTDKQMDKFMQLERYR